LAAQIKIAACQPAKRNAFAVQRLEQAGAFGLVVGEFPVPAATRGAYQFGHKEAGFHPTLEFALSEPGGFAEFMCGHSRQCILQQRDFGGWIIGGMTTLRTFR
jgi:hypothetical protein